MSENLKNFLCELSLAKNLPEHDYLFNLANNCSSLLENEKNDYRVPADDGSLGALLDFTPQKIKRLPVIIVPDIHARAYFLMHILDFKLPSDFVASENGKQLSVFEALLLQKIRVVCVGDLLHSELRGRSRWLKALEEFESHNFTGQEITSEMKEGLSLLSIIMELKLAFPENFHVLKGNHENIMNDYGEGNFPFRKFADEGEMVRSFMQEYYGDDVLMVISCFEKSLPLIAAFPECVVSHSEPAEFFSRQQLINGITDEKVVSGLTWTPNDSVVNNTCCHILMELTGNPDGLYFGGHRPISGSCTYRQGGKYIQLHNPDREFITLIHNDRIFDPDIDIMDVAK